MESRKIVLRNIFTENKWRCRVENGLVDTGKGRAGQTEKVAYIHMHIYVYAYTHYHV